MKPQRLQKILANSGLGSRRQIEKWIIAGRLKINNQPAKLGDTATIKDKIYLDNKPVKLNVVMQAQTKIIIYNKPEGQICTRNDPEGRDSVFDHLPKLKNGRWIMIGRLDINTSGLLLFTNDGQLAHKLMHPSNEVEREYAVRVLGEVDNKILRNLQKGVRLEDGMAKFNHIHFAGGKGANQWYHVVLKEGRNREVRRLWESQNITVSRLKRIRFGGATLPRNLKEGSWIYTDIEDI
jgi:23S rRNA pseudouridine2605 synthase